jgi:hypothetical protein
MLLLMIAVVSLVPALDNRSKRFDPIDLLKRITIGMSYDQVQRVLPRGAEQDVLWYIEKDRTFLLTVDLPFKDRWKASFIFDTEESAMRRPERLVEVRYSAMLSSRSESFESIVERVSRALGMEAETGRVKREGVIRKAGWLMTTGAILTLEYSIIPSSAMNPDAAVEFTVQSTARRRLTAERQKTSPTRSSSWKSGSIIAQLHLTNRRLPYHRVTRKLPVQRSARSSIQAFKHWPC